MEIFPPGMTPPSPDRKIGHSARRPELAICDITRLRLRALLAQACGDETAYRGDRDRYRALATSPGFEGPMAGAEAMP